VFWEAFPEHNPNKLDSPKNSYISARKNLTKTKYTISHINYHYKSIGPKIAKLVGYANYHLIEFLKFGNTPIGSTEPHI
jgi:hypothetical protein